MPSSVLRNVRTTIRYLVYGGCAFALIWAVFVCGSFLLSPFEGFDGESEFIALSAQTAKRRLPDWPDGVSESDVESVSYKSSHSRDSYSSWYCVKLTNKAARSWQDHAHLHQETCSRQCLNKRDEGLEGVRRTIDGPPPLHSKTGETPAWWSPPTIAFRATEVMLWYDTFYSGIGRATYTAFDASKQTLWIYDYACQHDTLWKQGNIPSGEVFTTLDQGSGKP
jgi:hypothetical protein